jgi:hypothetical protein
VHTEPVIPPIDVRAPRMRAVYSET